MNIYYIAGFPVSDELYHHGIKGQRWGVRRYQNEDGTLTAAGKARYGSGLGETVKSVKNKVSEKYQSGKASVISKAKSIDREKLKKAIYNDRVKDIMDSPIANVGMAVAAAYGAYRIWNIPDDPRTSLGRRLVTAALSGAGAGMLGATGFLYGVNAINDAVELHRNRKKNK